MKSRMNQNPRSSKIEQPGPSTEQLAAMKKRLHAGEPDPWGDMGSPRAGHTQHRTAQDVDARIDDVWGAFHKGRGMKKGQLAGSSYISKPAPAVTRVYIGNLALKAGLEEVKEQIGLNKKEYVLADPARRKTPACTGSNASPGSIRAPCARGIGSWPCASPRHVRTSVKLLVIAIAIACVIH